MPALNFMNGVKNVAGDKTQININTSVEFAALSGTFLAGTGDFVNLFELNATITNLKKESLSLSNIVHFLI